MATNGKHILIVDDYPDALDIWTLYLRSLGYEVSTAADGAAAIDQAEQLLPDLIVLDLELPGISGFEAARRLRRNPATQDIPLIAATGYSHHRQLAMAREAGFDQVVVKPIEPDCLVEEIERILDLTVGVRQPNNSVVHQARNNG
jgi:CheY-like chemotaxis protein